MGINLRVPQNSVKVDGRNSSIYLTQNAIKGDDGGYYIPSIDSEGNLTWAPSETEMPAVGGTNIKGPKGDSGVWVGTETPDGDYNVWVKPDDEAIEIATKADLDGKQDKLTAGTNITIENNVISAAGGGSDEVWIGSEEPTGDQTVWIDPTGSETAGLVTQAELANKQDKLTAGTNITIDSNNVISATQPTKTSELTNDSGFITNEYHDATKQDKLTAGTNITIDSNNVISATGSGGGGSYTLPVASDSTLGGVKVIHNSVFSSDDGNKVLMDDNNQLFIPYASMLGKVGLVGFNPDYFNIDGSSKLLSPKKATIANLGVVKPDGTTITIDDDGVISAAGSSGSSDTRFIVINKDVSDTLTDEEGALLYKAATNLGKYSLTFINNGEQYNNCIRIYKNNNSSRYYFVFYNTTYNDTSNNRIVRYYGSPINNKIKKLVYDWQYDTTLLDTNNWSSYISVPSDWNSTTDISDSNLYNAKEIAIYWEYNNIYHCNYYNFSSNNCLGYFNGYTFCAMNDYSNGNSTWDYNGSNINTNNMNIQAICYKT